MATETRKPPAPPARTTPRPQTARPDAEEGGGQPAPPTPPPPPAELPPFDERRLDYAELARLTALLDPGDLLSMVRDGRPLVRANAALGLAAVGHAAPDLVTLLRDSDVRVARAGAEAIARLGARARALAPPIVVALDGTQPEVTEKMVAALSELVGAADEDLVPALDVPLPLAMKTVVAACARLDKRGVAFLVRAAGDHRSRVRINAIAGLAHLGRADADAAVAFLTGLEAGDPVPDVRIEAKKAILAIIAPTRQEVVDSLPRNIPDFESRKLTASELREHAGAIDVDGMIYALQDGRDHVRVNAARCLAVVGQAAGRAARPMSLLLRDSVVQVRREVARALGKIGPDAAAAAPELVGALGDDEDVADAAGDTLAALGERVQGALVAGMETGSEPHGRRVVALIGRLPRAAETLTEAFRSPAVNVQVNAALGLGMLGGDRIGPGLPALLGARTGGDARTREAVRRALAMLDAGAERPREVAVAGFEERVLAAAELDKHRAELEGLGAAGLTAYLQDGRDVVRVNAATALGVVGPAAAAAARPLGVLLRDDALLVRLAAAQAIDRLGDGAVDEVADDLVRALATGGGGVAETCAAVLRARKLRVAGALVRGLETDDPVHARRIAELIVLLPDGPGLLCEAFEGPAVNVQVNAAMALGMLGPERVGKGRRLLEGARTGGDARTREAVRGALAVLDGPGQSEPGVVDVDGFEARVLGPEAFGNATRLRPGDVVPYLNDGRAHVRANAATALGALGPAAAPAVQALAVLLRDDDARVRIHAARALDKLGDEPVRDVADFLVGGLRGDAEVARAVAPVLGARKARVLGALIRGLETDDPVHARRILELVVALPDAGEILVDAFESAAENVQVNAAIGIGMLGPERAGAPGRKALEGARTGGFARTREAVFAALAMLGQR
ncbi:MAG TPA: HEAT repeat domain-containing protein [Kofleriaceae bacterium]|nr:HEAT repeat domain-containing protein [Kofleriaceae bacterium]